MPKKAAWPSDTMPAYPRMRSRESAKSAAMRIWLPSTRYPGKRKNAATIPSHTAISHNTLLSGMPPPEEPRRECDQHQHHRRVDHERARLGHVILRADVEHAQQERRGERAGDVARAADNHDEQEIHHELERKRR